MSGTDATGEQGEMGDAAPIDDQDERRYRAPALEKGLDILELITATSTPLTLATIAQRLGRSTGELFRMIQVLEHRGYIEQSNGSGYVPTAKLFAMGMRQAPVRNLLETALPVMRQLADETDQSCHLATRAAGDIVIVARMESASLIGFSVRLGHRRPLPQTASGLILYAYQPEDVRRRWEAQFDPPLSENALRAFRLRADAVTQAGFDQRESGIVAGVVDLSAPVMRGEAATAALTMPYVERLQGGLGLDRTIARIRAAAGTISMQLASSDVRV